LSFFYLENELPRWLDEVLLSSTHSGFTEIVFQNVINDMCAMSKKSYHSVCAGKGNMVIAGRQGHHIWKYEDQNLKMRTYGKYLEYTSNNTILRFWVGIVVQNKTINLYLWFGKIKESGILQRLGPFLVKGKYEYWSKKEQINNGQASDILKKCCECDSPPLKDEELEKLENEVKKATGELLNIVKQAVENK